MTKFSRADSVAVGQGLNGGQAPFPVRNLLLVDEHLHNWGTGRGQAQFPTAETEPDPERPKPVDDCIRASEPIARRFYKPESSPSIFIEQLNDGFPREHERWCCRIAKQCGHLPLIRE